MLSTVQEKAEVDAIDIVQSRTFHVKCLSLIPDYLREDTDVQDLINHLEEL